LRCKGIARLPGWRAKRDFESGKDPKKNGGKRGKPAPIPEAAHSKKMEKAGRKRRGWKRGGIK